MWRMAMGPVKGQEATRQVEIVCLDELVPEDDLYRRIDGLVDWGFVRRRRLRTTRSWLAGHRLIRSCC
jgi:hypothetical protein